MSSEKAAYKVMDDRPAQSVTMTMDEHAKRSQLKDEKLLHYLRIVSPLCLTVCLTLFIVIVSLVPRPSSLVHSAYAASEIPALKGYINDYANMMSPSIRSKLTNELREFERTDSTQIVILTISSLAGQPIEDFSIKVAEAWKIGQKGKDSGIILIVASQERKMRIEVGRGLEGKLTDLTAGRIIDLVIKPRFKRGDFNGGFVAGVAAMIDATKGEFKADDAIPPQKKKSFSPLFTILLFGGIGLLIMGSFSRILGGIAGAIGLPTAAYLTAGASIFTLVLFGILGLVMGIFLPFLFSGMGHGRGGMFFPGGWYLGSGGGGSGGDFDSGGGFSGGGGDFGGGGASGDW
jgi:uncharacterized protein